MYTDVVQPRCFQACPRLCECLMGVGRQMVKELAGESLCGDENTPSPANVTGGESWHDYMAGPTVE